MSALYKRNQYAFTVIGMLTNYLLCIPLIDKSADTVVSAYVKEMNCGFEGC